MEIGAKPVSKMLTKFIKGDKNFVDCLNFYEITTTQKL